MSDNILCVYVYKIYIGCDFMMWLIYIGVFFIVKILEVLIRLI